MTDRSQFLLLKELRFLPLFITQFLGAFHDNLFKNAMIVLLLFGAAEREDGKLLTTIAAGLFILPFVLFSAMGGQLADKFHKDRVIRVIKVAEIGIALLGAVSLLADSTILSFITLFALGAHSAFFGPSKYSILPQHLKEDELIDGNALVNTGTFLAILAGTVVGTSMIILAGGDMIVSVLLLSCAICGYAASRFIPPAPPATHDMKLDFNPVRETCDVVAYTLTRPGGVVLTVLGISWFWFMGSMFMAQLPNFVHETLAAREHVLTILLVLFSIGVAVGGLLNHRLLKGRVEAVYVPLAALGMTLFSLDLCLASAGTPGYLPWRVAADIALIGVCGGLYVVPLNAILQDRTPEDHRARVMAGSAIVDALFMVASALFCIALIAAGLDVRGIFFVFAVANAAVAFYIRRLLPPRPVTA